MRAPTFACVFAVLFTTAAQTFAGPEVSPDTLEFGTVVVSNSSSSELTISASAAGETITVTTIAISGSSAFTIEASPTVPFQVSDTAPATVRFRFAPSAVGAATAIARISFDTAAGAMTRQVALAGLGAPPLSASAADFGRIQAGSPAVTELTISNEGSADLQLVGAVVPSDFTLQRPGGAALSFPLSVPAQGTLALKVAHGAGAIGVKTGVIEFSTSSPAQPRVEAAVRAEVVSSLIEAEPAHICFPRTSVGGSREQILDLFNHGVAEATVTALTFTGPFSSPDLQVNDVIPAKSSIFVRISFEPVASGGAEGTLVVTTDAGSVTVELEGAAASDPGLVSGRSHDFGETFVGEFEEADLLIRNVGTAPRTYQGTARVFGPEFTVLSVDPVTIGPNEIATVRVRFTPALIGSAAGIAFLAYDGGEEVALRFFGRGVRAVRPAPALLDFGPVRIGESAAMAIVLSNQGGTSVTVQSVASTDSRFAISGLSAGDSIGAGPSATVSVTFTPAAGARLVRGSVILVLSDAPSLPLVIPVQGVAQGDVVASTDLVDFGSVPVGDAPAQVVQFTNQGTSSVTLSLSADSPFSLGAPSLALSPGETKDVDVRFVPTASGIFRGTLVATGAPNLDPEPIELRGTALPVLRLERENPFDSFEAPLGEIDAGAFLLTNESDRDLTIAQVSTGTGPFAVLRLEDGASSAVIGLPGPLPKGGTVRISIAYAPARLGDQAGTLAVEIQDPAGGVPDTTVSAPLEGRVLTGRLVLRASNFGAGAISFEEVEVENPDASPPRCRQRKEDQVVIENAGAAPLRIESVKLRGAHVDSFFLLTDSAFPRTLQAGQNIVVTVGVEPVRTGLLGAELEVRSDDPLRPVATLGIVAAAVKRSADPSVPVLVVEDLHLVDPVPATPTTAVGVADPFVLVTGRDAAGVPAAPPGASPLLAAVPGITVRDVRFSGTIDEDATLSGAGFFSKGPRGILDGVVLASGAVTNTLPPNKDPGTTSDFGDSGGTLAEVLVEITAVAPVESFDLQQLEIVLDTGAQTNSIAFDFVFGSEEYPEYTQSPFNDVFGAFLFPPESVLRSGTYSPAPPNAKSVDELIEAPFADLTEEEKAFLVAHQVSLDANGDPITINGRFFSGPSVVIPPYNGLEYDGSTDRLRTIAPVLPSTAGYRLFFVVADAGDQILDSGVFLSFLTGRPEVVDGPRTAVVAPDIDVVPAIVDFGFVEAGSRPVGEMKIENVGLSDLTVSDVRAIGGAILSNVPSLPFALAPGESATVFVGIDAPTSGFFAGQVEILSDDPNEELFTVPVEAQAVEASLVVEPELLAFERAGDRREAIISNEGDLPIRISAIAIEGADAGAFSLEDSFEPFTLGARESRSVPLLYAPARVGAEAAVLRVVSDDPILAERTVTLAGAGLQAGALPRRRGPTLEGGGCAAVPAPVRGSIAGAFSALAPLAAAFLLRARGARWGPASRRSALRPRP